MKERVFFIKVSDNEDDSKIVLKLKKLIEEKELLSFAKKNDAIAVKTHFGESEGSGYARPLYFTMLGELLKKKGALPFLTETATLYRGNRTNAITHVELAHKHGFGYENTGLPVIMADGLFGDEEVEVKIDGKINSSVKIASLVKKVQGLVVVSHFTGHMVAGFGAALKNIGMGLSSRKGKMVQHSTAKPSVKSKYCTRCGICGQWCPADAITIDAASAVIDENICIGCGQCLAMCRFDAITYNWGATYEDLQKNVVEHAWGVHNSTVGKVIYINFLTRISKDCDCMSEFEKIMPDIGVLVSTDPVALDAASLDFVEKYSGKKISEMSYNIPYRYQIDYARELGFGNSEYEIVEV